MKAGNDAFPDLRITPSDPVYQLASLVEVPAAARILTVGTYIRSIAGFGSTDFRICVWKWGGSLGAAHPLLGKTAVLHASPAADATENLLKVTADLEEAVEIALPFTDVMIGPAWETDPARLVNVGGYTAGTRWKKELAAGAGWPSSMTDATTTSPAHAVAGWIEEYVPLTGIFVFRAGEWLQIPGGDAVLVQRAGIFETASAVRVRRAGAWVDVPW